MISVGAASGHPMTVTYRRVETFMTAWPVGQDLQYVIQLAEGGSWMPRSDIATGGTSSTLRSKPSSAVRWPAR